MSSSSKVKPVQAVATNYTPLDIAVDNQLRTKENHFSKSEFFLDSVNFTIDPQVATQMGLTNARNKEDKRLFDAEVLKFVQTIKDDAYAEAYKLGREEGVKVAKAEALIEAEGEIKNKLQAMVEMTQGLDNYRQKMYALNETEIVRFCYFLAEKILLKEVKANKEYVAEIIKKMIPDDEPCEIRLSTPDHTFIQTHMHLLEKELNMQAVKFIADDTLKDGDVIVETKNGILDGTLQTRLQKLKHSIEQME